MAEVKRVFLGQVKSQFAGYIKNRMVIQVGGLSDPLDFHERKHGIMLELLKFWREIDYPISISTKGVWFADDPRYVELLTGGNVHLKSSIISLDANKVRAIERGVATSEQRFQMIEKMAAKGVQCTVRFRPLILGMSADYPYTETSRQQIRALVKRSFEAGAISITTEFLCLEAKAKKTAEERYNIIGEHTGWGQPGSLYEFYRQQSDTRSGLMRLNYGLKKPYMEAFMEACEAYGLPGFISDAHHKEKSAAAGCCGLPSTGPLSVYNKGQFAEAILIAKAKGKVHWSDIEPLTVWLKEVPFYRAENFNTSSTNKRQQNRFNNMQDYMHNCWNVPELVMSPARYFGGALVGGEIDAHGDMVYYYNAAFIESLERKPDVQAIRLDLVERGYKMQEDGEEWAHINLPIVVNCHGADKPVSLCGALLRLLMKYRLNPLVYVREIDLAAYRTELPDLEYRALPDIMGKAEVESLVLKDAVFKRVAGFWLLDGSITRFTAQNANNVVKLEQINSLAGALAPLLAAGQQICSPRAYLSAMEYVDTAPPYDPQRAAFAERFPKVEGAVLWETEVLQEVSAQWH